jgi:hypothetical protein
MATKETPRFKAKIEVAACGSRIAAYVRVSVFVGVRRIAERDPRPPPRSSNSLTLPLTRTPAASRQPGIFLTLENVSALTTVP